MPIIPISGSAAPRGALVPIAQITATTPGTAFTFNNIPAIYRDLRVVLSVRTNGNDALFGMNAYLQSYPNNSATVTSGTTWLIGNGTTVSSTRFSSQILNYLGYVNTGQTAPNVFTSATVDILNYASTTSFKQFITRTSNDANGSGTSNLTVSSWASTAAINALIFYSYPDNFVVGSTATLYGIRSVGQ
jgi:hypothetical protein